MSSQDHIRFSFTLPEVCDDKYAIEMVPAFHPEHITYESHYIEPMLKNSKYLFRQYIRMVVTNLSGPRVMM